MSMNLCLNAVKFIKKYINKQKMSFQSSFKSSHSSFQKTITKTTQSDRRVLSVDRQNSVETPPEPPKISMLYGKDLKSYENIDVEKLLSQLSAEELEQLSQEVDPDDNLLPASQRCKDQTTKSATGPLNRKKLIEFLKKFAQEQEDWPELNPFQIGLKRGNTLNISLLLNNYWTDI